MHTVLVLNILTQPQIITVKKLLENLLKYNLKDEVNIITKIPKLKEIKIQ